MSSVPPDWIEGQRDAIAIVKAIANQDRGALRELYRPYEADPVKLQRLVTGLAALTIDLVNRLRRSDDMTLEEILDSHARFLASGGE